MQKIILFTLVSFSSLLLISFKPSPRAHTKYHRTYTAPTVAKATWVKDVHDFGTIALRVPVSVEFAFTNTGDAPLIIKEVITSCGCTAPDYTKEPIMPGKSSAIKVNYNAANAGAFSKTITVKTNETETGKTLIIRGTVK
jgi:hypothetical protein